MTTYKVVINPSYIFRASDHRDKRESS